MDPLKDFCKDFAVSYGERWEILNRLIDGKN